MKHLILLSLSTGVSNQCQYHYGIHFNFSFDRNNKSGVAIIGLKEIVKELHVN